MAVPAGTFALLSAVTALTRGGAINGRSPSCSFQAYATTTSGTGTATVIIQGSDVTAPSGTTDVDWVTLGTITLSSVAVTQTTDGFSINASWYWLRAQVTVITGTGTSVTCMMGFAQSV